MENLRKQCFYDKYFISVVSSVFIFELLEILFLNSNYDTVIEHQFLFEIGSSGAFLAAADWQALGWKLWKKNARVIARVGRAIHLLHRVLGVDFGD
ncbi:hypothetical protein T4D_10451 [Trichinella pseudospiralis]|uniref:Uncharacterized protein n=1 Tax=Trichinella pseudospiralis TaxID=6337 RepID=A0A0V1FQJ8_TRIPS|nr:hypothetical protein T4D_10451 [Trichinella pseudospiralis]